MSFFDGVKEAPPDAIFGLSAAFQADPRPSKINLSVGVFKSPDLRTPILESVKRAEHALASEELSKEYLPIEGQSHFLQQVGLLVFGEAFWAKEGQRIASLQGVGGTGALRIGGDFLAAEVGKELYISDPSWPNHHGTMARCGFILRDYPYYDREKQALDFERFYSFVAGLKAGSVLLLHAGCHNPTGADPSLAQWKQLSKLCLEKGIFPFFDFAYQGFDRGLGEDAQAIRLFAEEGHEMAVASSCSKNFGLYAERVGALFLLTRSKETARKAMSRLRTFARTTYSNPPLHGAAIVGYILSHPLLRAQWEEELQVMRERVCAMRDGLADALIAKSTQRDYRFLKERRGMFCFCGLEKAQVDRLIAEDGIYMTGDGRINVCGLNAENLESVVKALLKVSA